MEPNLLLRIIKTGWRQPIQTGMKALVQAQCEIYCCQNQKINNDNGIFHDDTRFCWIPSGRWKRSTPPLTVARLMLSSQSVTLSEQSYCLKHQKMVTVTTLRAWKTFQTELSAGSDGRADFVERKACNWITDTFQVDLFKLVVALSSYHTFQFLFLGLFGYGLDRKLVVL